MNISHLLQHVTQLKGGEAQKTELKEGQLIKGTVLQMAGGREALLQIQGAAIKAVLQTEMKIGTTAWFQVLPNSDQGDLQLRLAPQSHTSNSITHLLQQLQLRDSDSNRMMIQQLQKEGLPLSKENITNLQQMMSAKPENIPASSWSKAAMFSMQKSIPLSVDSVRAIHEVMFGPKLHESLKQLQQQIQQHHTQPQTATAINMKSSSSTIIQQLFQQLQQFEGLARTIAPNLSASAVTTSLATAATTTAVSQSANSISTQTTQANPIPQTSAVASANTTVQPSTSYVSFSVPIPQTSIGPTTPSLTTVQAQGQPQSQAPIQNVQAAPLSQVQANVQFQGQVKQQPSQPHAQFIPTPVLTNVQQSIQSQTTHAQESVSLNASSVAAAQPAVSEPIVLQLMKIMGIQHEQEITRFFNSTAMNSSVAEQNPGQRAEGQPQMLQNLSENIKGLLMQLQAADDIPATLKEAAQQLNHQITGQQLLLTSDRLPFSHMMMMLPLVNEQGEQTASVTIQSRKGKNNQLDANNCRLLFDLSMNVLGHMILDVQVIEKNVRLKILNDFPQLEDILKNTKNSVEAGLEKMGYGLLSVTAAPYPKVQEKIETDASISSTVVNIKDQTYKGVDLRI